MFSKTRIISAIVMMVALFVIVLIDNFFVNFAVFAILLFLAFNEAKAMFKAKYANVFIALAIFFIGVVLDKPFLIGVFGFILILGYFVYKKADNLKTLMPYIYPTLPILMLYEILAYHGMFVLFWLIVIVAACDSGAYLIGKMIGERSFSKTSPNKTLEGVIGGVACAAILGTMIGLIEFSLIKSIVVSLLVAIFAIIGDLLESYFKREANIKDSGTLIPGHGGVLDRIDAVIIAAFAMAVLV